MGKPPLGEKLVQPVAAGEGSRAARGGRHVVALPQRLVQPGGGLEGLDASRQFIGKVRVLLA